MSKAPTPSLAPTGPIGASVIPEAEENVVLAAADLPKAPVEVAITSFAQDVQAMDRLSRAQATQTLRDAIDDLKAMAVEPKGDTRLQRIITRRLPGSAGRRVVLTKRPRRASIHHASTSATMSLLGEPVTLHDRVFKQVSFMHQVLPELHQSDIEEARLAADTAAFLRKVEEREKHLEEKCQAVRSFVAVALSTVGHRAGLSPEVLVSVMGSEVLQGVELEADDDLDLEHEQQQEQGHGVSATAGNPQPQPQPVVMPVKRLEQQQ